MKYSSHPQLVHLERQIAWFLDHPEHDLCVIVEPESQSIVRFYIPLKSKRGYRSAHLGRIMTVELTPDEAEREDLMLKLGFKPSGQRKGTFDGVRNSIFPQFEKKTTNPHEAAQEVAQIMRDVYLLGDSPWLWTFHVDDPDQWPDPLPKPAVWPPA